MGQTDAEYWTGIAPRSFLVLCMSKVVRLTPVNEQSGVDEKPALVNGEMN
jgi:hypothetical protein